MPRAEDYPRLLAHLGDAYYSGAEEVRAPCPVRPHRSEDPFSVNFGKGLARCFACGEGWTLDQAEYLLSAGVPDGGSAAPAEGLPESNPESAGGGGSSLPAGDFWVSRGFPADGPEGVDWAEVGDHLRLYSHEGKPWSFQDRNLGEEGPRYHTPEGGSGLFYYGDPASDTVWIVEGPFDALSIYRSGARFVIASLGADQAASREIKFAVRGRTVLLALDNDPAGYEGTLKARAALREHARVRVVEYPAGVKDANELLLRGGLEEFVREAESRGGGDRAYVDRMFTPETESLLVLPTGLSGLDKYLRGGYRPGIHIVAGEPAAGKTALVHYFTRLWAMEGGRSGLLISTEIPKRQSWSRLVSPMVGVTWSDIEDRPIRAVSGRMEELYRIQELAGRVRVVRNPTIDELIYQAPGYDFVVIDYLQTMRDMDADPRLAVNRLLELLGDLVAEHNTVVLAVSEFHRAAYRRERGVKPVPDKTSYKETGRIEYASQSALNLVRGDGSNVVEGHLVKNTRGPEGRFFMKADLGAQVFEDFVPAAGGS